MANAPIPLAQSERIPILDSLRGFALLGILLMNIPFFSTPMSYHNNLTLFDEFSGPNFWCWILVNGFLEGSMRALFSILFGAGSLLLISRLEIKEASGNPADIYYRRLLWLFLFGMLNAFIFQWPGDILYAYSICGLFLFPFRNLKPNKLVYFALAFLVFGSIYVNLNYYEGPTLRKNFEKTQELTAQGQTLTDADQHAIEEWYEFKEKNKRENVLIDGEAEIEQLHGNWVDTFLHMRPINVTIQTQYMYKEYFFDVLLFFFIGMALFKWRILTGERSLATYWIFFAMYIPGGLLAYWGLHTMMAANFDTSLYTDYMPLNLYHLRRMYVAFGHIGLFMLLYKYGVFQWVLRSLAAVGQMAFTNYLMQSLICTIIFYGFGFGLYGELERYQTYIVVVCIWIFQILFSTLWMKYFLFGPFEWLWRSLTYWKKQPFAKSRSQLVG